MFFNLLSSNEQLTFITFLAVHLFLSRHWIKGNIAGWPLLIVAVIKKLFVCVGEKRSVLSTSRQRRGLCRWKLLNDDKGRIRVSIGINSRRNPEVTGSRASGTQGRKIYTGGHRESSKFRSRISSVFLQNVVACECCSQVSFKAAATSRYFRFDCRVEVCF